MNACASQIFWSISSPVIRDPSRLLLNFNGSHKVSVSAWRLVLPSARQSTVILYFHRRSRVVWCCYLTLSDILMGCFLAFLILLPLSSKRPHTFLWKLIYSLRRCEEIAVYSMYLHGWRSHTWLHFFTGRAADSCKLHLLHNAHTVRIEWASVYFFLFFLTCASFKPSGQMWVWDCPAKLCLKIRLQVISFYCAERYNAGANVLLNGYIICRWHSLRGNSCVTHKSLLMSLWVSDDL